MQRQLKRRNANAEQINSSAVSVNGESKPVCVKQKRLMPMYGRLGKPGADNAEE